MLERFAFYASKALIHTFICWVGIKAFLIGLKRYGITYNFPLRLSFILLWINIFLVGIMFGETGLNNISILSVVLVFIGIPFWLISIIYSFSKKFFRQNE